MVIPKNSGENDSKNVHTAAFPSVTCGRIFKNMRYTHHSASVVRIRLVSVTPMTSCEKASSPGRYTRQNPSVGCPQSA